MLKVEGISKYKEAKSIIENDGSHKFEGIEMHIESIIDFYHLDEQE